MATLRRREAIGMMAAVLVGGTAAGDTRIERRLGSARLRSLGQPCQARNILAASVIQDGGRDTFVLANMSDPTGLELIFIDPDTGAGEVYRAPAGDRRAGAWALVAVPGDRLVVGTFYDGAYLVFDRKRREWVKSVKFAGEQYFWNAALAADGRVYGGTYPGGKLGALDLTTCAIEDLGNPAKPNLYLRGVYPLPDGRLFCHYGEEKPENFLFDPATKQYVPAPPALAPAAAGASWNGYFLTGDQAFHGHDLALAAPLPFPVPDPKNGAWAIEPKLTDAKTLVLRQGEDVYRFRAGDTALTHLARIPVKGLFLYGIDEADRLYGVRGQEYAVIRPGGNVTLRRIPGKSGARTVHFLRADDDGRVWGGPTFGQTLFYLDTKTGNAVNTLTVSDHSGEVYDVAVSEGIAYAVAYVFGEIVRFDPNAPWDQIHHHNPRTIAKVSPDYIRPAAGIRLGNDGRLYSGWWAKYGSYGGALAITDPKTGKTDVVRDPLGAQGLTALAVTGGGTVLLGSTTRGNGLPARRGVASAFGVYDLTAGKTVFQRDFPGIGSVCDIVCDERTRRAAVLLDDRLWVFDTAGRTFLGDGPVVPEKVTCESLALRDSCVLYACDALLWSYDLRTGHAARIATLPSHIGKLTTNTGGDIFVACKADVYQVLI